MFVADDSIALHKLCQTGNLRRIKAIVRGVDPQILSEKLANRKGVFGYTPLHEAVVGGKPEVLRFLLDRAGNASVNSRSNNGYSPLHLAASSGHEECIRALLEHGADISCTDEFGKTPKQTAELGARKGIVRLLLGEGEQQYQNRLRVS